MILLAAKIAKIGVFLLGFFSFAVICKKRSIEVKWRIAAAVILIISAVLGIKAASAVPILTDTVTVTALGEKNDKASSDEIMIRGFTVDGEDYSVDEIQSGKWFWIGDDYVWRNEEDSRQPEGTTRSVTLFVPVGWGRTLNFETGEYRGFAEIDSAKGTQIVDTSVTENVRIGRSETSSLIWNQIRQILAYTAVIAAAFFGLLAVLLHRDQFLLGCRKHRWPLLYAAIALCQFIFAVHYSGGDCFWTDELCEITWIETSKNIFDQMFRGNMPNPLFGAFIYVWYKIVPYGERWLLLPMEFMTALSIFFTGLSAREIKDGKAGFMAAAFMALSSNLLLNESYEIRRYSFFCCFAAILIYLYIRRWRHPGQESAREIAWITVFMVLFSDMHFFGVIYCAVLFCLDVYLYFKKKIRIQCIIPYIVSAIAYIPVLIKAFLVEITEQSWSWMGTPSILSIQKLVNFLCSNTVIVPLFLFIGAGWAVAYAHASPHKGHSNEGSIKFEIPLYYLVLIIGNVAVVFVYGRLNPSFSIWVERYFVALLPLVFALAGCGASFLCDQLGHEVNDKWMGAALPVALVLIVFHGSYSSLLDATERIHEDYRYSAEWLYSQDDIYNKDTLVVWGDWYSMMDGWDVYYMTKQGARDPVDLAFQSSLTKESLSEYNKLYVVYRHSAFLPASEAIILDDFMLESDYSEVNIKAYIRDE